MFALGSSDTRCRPEPHAGPLPRIRTAIAALVLFASAVLPLEAAELTPDGRPSAPVTAAHRYRLSAAIRPLLFWVGAANVGGAQIVWRQDEGARRGYELLLGSDPARAPRRINRWGFVREDEDRSGATMIGVMNRSEDDSLDQAKAGLGKHGRRSTGYPHAACGRRLGGGPRAGTDR